MQLSTDDEILQDFLVEAFEIVEQLGEQLVDLEQQPDDSDLLNAIFRGFHTVKGGAGFLAITPLVETCHHAEDVFNVLRQGQRAVDPELMDAIPQALDVVNASMGMIRDGEMPEPADAPAEVHCGHVVVVNVSGVQVGLVVDYLVGQEEVVIKPLGALLQGLDGMAGATITGDGKIALILDVPGLIRKYAHRY